MVACFQFVFCKMSETDRRLAFTFYVDAAIVEWPLYCSTFIPAALMCCFDQFDTVLLQIEHHNAQQKLVL